MTRVPRLPIAAGLALGLLLPGCRSGHAADTPPDPQPASAAAPAPTGPPLGAFRFTVSVDLPGTPAQVYDAFTGDVTAWWDHHMSEDPVAMVIEPRVGGRFIELFDAAGNGCVHADVTYAQHGRMLRMVGPLGLAGNAVHAVHTLTFEAIDGGTRLTLVCEASGHVEPAWAGVVESVWRHFLVERFQPWYEAGAVR